MSDRTYQYIIDASKLTDKEVSHAYLAEALDFPDYYGGNLDALYDCLTELCDSEIIIENVDESGEYYGTILSVLLEATEDNDELELTINEQILDDEEEEEDDDSDDEYDDYSEDDEY